MMRLGTYAGLSFLGAIAVIYHAFNSREQFYPATVYLSTSKISLVLLLNTGLVIMCIMWQLVKCFFLGSLREAEVERLNEQSWREVMEILFAITIFRQDFSVGFLAMVTALLLIKALHWLAQKRVEYIETTPTVSMLSHVRIVSFMGFLLLLDCLFLYSSLQPLIQTWQASVALFFSFEYMILATTTISTFIKYAFYVSDMLMEGQWENRAVYTFYVELIRDLLHLSMYLFFFMVIFMNYGVPLHLIRELYETFRNFKIRIADYLRYRKITSNMNERFPDATADELNAGDATCIICREEMVTAKKLLCGHLFHVHCLRSWLERQHTCPTCRSLVVPPDNASHGSVRQHAVPSQTHHSGSGAAETSNQSLQNATRSKSTPHEMRIHAAASAAAIYQKSFVHPHTKWSPGYALVPQTSIQTQVTSNEEGRESAGTTSSQAPRVPSVWPDITFPQVPQYTFLAQLAQPDVQASLLEANEGLQRQIQGLQKQLELLQRQMSVLTLNPDAGKGKMVATTLGASSSSGGSGDHEESMLAEAHR